MRTVVDFKQFINESIITDMVLPQDVLDISEIYKAADKKLYVVGGAVRDFLLGKKPKDFDLATDATPDESIEILSDHYKIVEVGKAFGVIKIMTEDEPEGYELATFREDVGSGRRPDGVTFTSIDKDVLRRDLTVNALFYDIELKKIVDLVGGIDDLNKGIVRTVGKAKERFDEDPLRRLRAVRFASKLGSRMDPDLHSSLKKDSSISGVSPERIRDEFLKILKSAKDVKKSVEMMDDYGLLEQIFPGLLIHVDRVSDFPFATVALILRGNPAEKVSRGLNKLTWTDDEIKKISFLISLQGINPESAYDLKKMEKIAKFYYLDEIEDFAKKAGIDPVLIKAFLKYIPRVSSQELMDLGFSGQDLGKEIKRREAKSFLQLLGDI